MMENTLLNIKVDSFKKILGRGQDLFLTVRGTSMWPFLNDGQEIIIRRCPWEKISVGDLVLTFHRQRILCHRVLIKGKRTLETKPDALFGFDGPVTEKEVLGRVTGFVINGKLHRTDGPFWRLKSLLTVCWTLVAAPVYPALRFLKHLFTGERLPSPRNCGNIDGIEKNGINNDRD